MPLQSSSSSVRPLALLAGFAVTALLLVSRGTSTHAHLDPDLPGLSFCEYATIEGVSSCPNGPGDPLDVKRLDPVNLLFVGVDSPQALVPYFQAYLGWQQKTGLLCQASNLYFIDHGLPVGFENVEMGTTSNCEIAADHVRLRDGAEDGYVLGAAHNDLGFCFSHQGTDFDDVRDQIANAFSSHGHAVTYKYVGNTLPTQQLCTNTNSTDGMVAIVSPCIPSGDQTAINSVLVGPGSKAVLCRNAVFNLTSPVVFSAGNQEIYTEGFPRDSARAVLRVTDPTLVTAVNGLNRSSIKIKNIQIDGNRPNLGHVPGGGPDFALLRLGGDASAQVVDHVKAYEPRGWTALHLFEGDAKSCTGAAITNNELGPAGQADGTWADGISLACRGSLVAFNTITDATDGGIVVFGAPGSLISDNTIRAESRTLLGGINMVDFGPFGGDYGGTRVNRNLVDASGAQVKTGIAMGPLVWNCPGPDWPAGPNRGGSVTNNTLIGAKMGYGFVSDGVENWTVSGNVSNAVHSGNPGAGCNGQTPAAPRAFQRHGTHSQGTFQAEFVDELVEKVIPDLGEPVPLPAISISAVSGRFFDKPNSGSFTAVLGDPIAFNQTFPVINFNPPSGAVSCTNATGVGVSSRPFTDVVPQLDGSCLTIPAQGNGYQAGVGDLVDFQAVFTGSMSVSSAANVTFSFYSDDGWIFSIGPEVHTDAQPGYVTGPLINRPSAGPFTGYSVVGSYNVPSSPARNDLIVSFPAPGTYPFELDYTECCGGPLVLTLAANAAPIPQGGSIAGVVYAGTPDAANAVSAAYVQVCGLGPCATTLTSASGAYRVAGLPAGLYSVTAFPPGGSTLAKGTVGPVNLSSAASLIGQDIVLSAPTPLPPGTSITNRFVTDGGLPVVYWNEPLQLATKGCSGANAFYQVVREGSVLRSGPMTEGPAGTYAAILSALYPEHGEADVRITLDCPTTPDEAVSFNIYIDPSGTVRTPAGDPVAGVKVTLFRSDSLLGSFEPVANGSGIMSSANRNNPDTTDAKGHFGWDVIAGFYIVRAEKPGCISPDDPGQAYVETPVLTIPPAVTDLDLRLDCPAIGIFPGDVDCSLAVNAVDALKVLRHVAVLSVSQTDPCLDLGEQLPDGRHVGDVNCRDGVNAVDALLILRSVARLPVSQAQGCPPINGPP